MNWPARAKSWHGSESGQPSLRAASGRAANARRWRRDIERISDRGSTMGAISRRPFTQAAAAFPYIVARRVFGANDRIRVGVIGVGVRSNLLIDQLPSDAEVVAVADCNIDRCREAAQKRNAQWRIHQDYRRMLEQKHLHRVIHSTPHH